MIKDTTGAQPDMAKRLAQELVTRDQVDILAGFGLTPNALAVAPVATEAKKPMVIMNAATSVITTRSPYIVRVSHTLPQDTQPMALWAAKNGIKRVFTLVSDFGPGVDAETAFTKAFKAVGGEIVDSVRTPLQNPDFAPFLQRAKDAKPEALFVFLPPGSQTIAFIKGYDERGLKQAGIKLIATGDLTDDGVLQAMGEPTVDSSRASTTRRRTIRRRTRRFSRPMPRSTVLGCARISWRAQAMTAWRRSRKP